MAQRNQWLPASATLLVATILGSSCAPRGRTVAVPAAVSPTSDTARTRIKDDSVSVAAVLDTIVGTIRRVDLEGGFWGLLSDDGQRYDPTGSLPRAAQQEGARVRVVASKRNGVATFRMWGTMIDVVSCEQLGDSVK